jgi:hypothetical protein
MPKYAAKVDANQPEIVRDLRHVGAFVFPTHTIGRGFPDLVTIFRGTVYLLEVKMPGGDLTPEERKFYEDSQGLVYIVRSSEDALRAIGAMD